MKTKILFTLLAIIYAAMICHAQTNSQEKTVTLMVSGEASTKEEATTLALRSAIEQAFGTFVSANTRVVNDQLIKDEIVTISNGNILDFKEISTLTLPDGQKSVTVQATVSIGNLTRYANNKGMQTELSGATFLMNKRMEEFNTKNEKRALRNMLEQYARVLPKMFDLVIEPQEPIVKDNKYDIPCVIKFIANENTIEAKKLWIEALTKLNVGYYYTTANYNVLGKSGKETEYSITFENFHDKIKIGNISAIETTLLKMYFRNDYSWLYKQMNKLFGNCLLSTYVIKDNFGNHYAIEKSKFGTKDPLEQIKLEFGNTIPAKSDSRWHFGNERYMALPSLNQKIEKGEVMYQQMIVLTYTEEQMNKLSNIKIEPNEAFDESKMEFLTAEDYISEDGRDHQIFDGVYLDGEIGRVISSLEKRGYILKQRKGESSAIMTGEYLGNDVDITINTTSKSHKVWGIDVALPKYETWNELKECYNKMKEYYMTQTKYYKIMDEKFEAPYYDGCGKEMDAVIIPQKCLYATRFETQDGFVTVVINSNKRVYICYRDWYNFQDRDY